MKLSNSLFYFFLALFSWNVSGQCDEKILEEKPEYFEGTVESLKKYNCPLLLLTRFSVDQIWTILYPVKAMPPGVIFAASRPNLLL